MKNRLLLGIVLISAALFLALKKNTDPHHSVESVVEDDGAMIIAANAILDILSEEQAEKALKTFKEEERFRWFFVPIYRQRKGLSLEEMTVEQKEKTFDLLQSALSEQGIDKVQGIMSLESVLREIEQAEYRNPELYYLTIFGKPSKESPWGWRYEGHHLSLNFTSVKNEISVTPAFMGTNPGRVLSGPQEGKQVLKAEEEIARSFIESLNDNQKELAVISDTVPADIFTGNDRKVGNIDMEGIKYGQLSEEQQKAFLELLQVYLGNMKKEIADKQQTQIFEAGLENLHFAWIGGTKFREPHYYRIHGPTILIEYDNIQNGANHVHAVWRDLLNDFGEDMLRRHYETSDHH